MNLAIANPRVNLAAKPSLPQGYTNVRHHIPGPADFAWDPGKIGFYRCEYQTEENQYSNVEGFQFFEWWVEIVGRNGPNGPFLNANLLDYLLENPHLIPEAWKEKDSFGRRLCIFFWGTVYQKERKFSWVRCLMWSEEAQKWVSGEKYLGSRFLANHVAAYLMG